MKTIEERRLEILEWEKNNRNINNRSTANGGCVYSGEIGCAVGRLIEDKDLCLALDNEDGSSVYDVFERFPDNVKGLGMDFLRAVQDLHDTAYHWDESGLTNSGLYRYNEIKKVYCA